MDTKIAELSQQIDTFSYDEIVSAISLLAEKLKNSFSNNSIKDSQIENDEQYINLKKAFALSNSMHLNSHGKKISREELYER